MKILLLITILGVFSCASTSSKKTTIIINNKSKENIDSVRISSYGVNETYKDFGHNTTQSRTVNVELPDGFSKGGFGIALYQKGVVVKELIFGYYSSYSEIDDDYIIDILEGLAIKSVRKNTPTNIRESK